MPKALVFDLMGTCVDWFTSIRTAMDVHLSSAGLSKDELDSIAMDWRMGFFHEIHSQYEGGLEQEDIDVTHRRVLDRLLSRRNLICDDDARVALVKSWHVQKAWPDALVALERLKKRYFVIVLANGTTRLQLDIVKSSGLAFDALFSSQLLGLTKPDPRMYIRCAELLDIALEDCLTVAAHAYDLRAASKVGMKTAYIQRTTEDCDEDMVQVREENDQFFEIRVNTDSRGGLLALADALGC